MRQGEGTEIRGYLATNKLNLIKRERLESVVAKRNAVIFDYFEDYDDEGNPYMRRFVAIECKDEHMKEFLLQAARELLK